MSPFAVEVHPLAADEAEAAERWYRERSETAAMRFRRELDRVVELIAERPEAAPPYIGNTRRYHCYVKRQPSSNAEMEKALHVLRGQELDCVRYRGTDEAILRRLAEAGEAQQCDHPPAGVGVVLRNVVTFAISDPNHLPCDAPGFLEEFSAYLKARYSHLEVRTKPIEVRDGEASFALAWFEEHFHPIAIRPVDESGRWLILHRGNLGLSEFLDDWLRSAQRFTDLRWYTEDAWQDSEGWQSSPW